MIRVEPVSPAAPEARALIEASDRELAALYPPEARFAASPEALEAQRAMFWLARDQNGEAMGCVGLAIERGWGELKRLFVSPACRGRGVAEALLATVDVEAAACGLGVLRLETGTASFAALRLYARLGWRPRGPFGVYRENGLSVFLEKRLGAG